MKMLIALAATVAVLGTTGCCWPMYEYGHHRGRGRYGQNGGWSDHDSARPPPPRVSSNDRGHARGSGGW